jgi:hypothetical protein
VHIVNSELNADLEERYQIRVDEIIRILLNMKDSLTEKELKRPETQAIIKWLESRADYYETVTQYRANPGEYVEAFEERIRITTELTEIFPSYRVGACANLWTWLMLGANGRSTTEGKPITSSQD